MKKKMIQIVFPVVLVFFACGICFAIGPGDLQDLTGLTAADLANRLVGAGNVAPPPLSAPVFTGSRSGAGTFTNGLIDGLGINSGVILSTGDIFNAVGPNVDPSAGLDNGLPGLAALDALITPGLTANASTLDFFLVPPPNVTTVTFKYVFASDEYGAPIASLNDVFGVFVDGQNVALVPGTTNPVSVNTLNSTATPLFFNSNATGLFGTQYNGFSAPLTATATVTPGAANQIRLAIADGGAPDRVVDSAVFLGPVTSAFQDMPLTHPFVSFVMAIANAGITGGCSAVPTFCPDNPVTRSQMAVFIETSLGHPANACSGAVFGDVNSATVGDAFCGFIEKFAADGITGGCAPGAFCPNDPITRGQMAVFIETALGNPANACSGQFTDVTAANPFCGFIERLAADGITGGCAAGRYCPNDPVTRGQMAVFLVAAPAPLNP